MITTKRQVEAKRKKLISAIDILWKNLVVGDAGKYMYMFSDNEVHSFLNT